MISATLLCLTAPATAQDVAVAEAKALYPTSELLESVMMPKPIKRVPPTYPRYLARSGSEGWVQLSFVVGKNGRVLDPVVADSSGISGFEKAAMRAIKKWQYNPAFVDGEAVEQCQQKVQLDFKMDKTAKGVRHKFRRAYIAARDALEANDLLQASELTANLRAKNQWNSMESAWFWLLAADLAKAQGDEIAELANINRVIATDSYGELLGQDYFSVLLNRQFVLHTARANYAAALDTFNRIETQPDNQQSIDSLRPYADKILAILKGEQIIGVPAVIGENGNWWHKISRSALALADINGELDTIELRCHNRREIYSAATDSTWNIPASWGRCSVRVVGAPQSTFTLVELHGQT
ncbi:MAG: TonB family protein [Paraglaciecola sp.]|jgi:TonB family protein